jgi:hypothetical protein
MHPGRQVNSGEPIPQRLLYIVPINLLPSCLLMDDLPLLRLALDPSSDAAQV